MSRLEPLLHLTHPTTTFVSQDLLCTLINMGYKIEFDNILWLLKLIFNGPSIIHDLSGPEANNEQAFY